MTSILKASHLQKYYGERHVVKDVSLEIAQGQIVGLLGPNGAGKTTSFYMIVGLTASDGGQVTLAEQDITHFPMPQRAQMGIGYLPQEASVFRKLTVEDNILAILELRKDLTLEQRYYTLESLLQEFHITAVRHTLGISLSGGERRRVEIARALAMNPQFILLDEPFAGVDPISVIDIKRIIMHLRDRGIGILITDHNVRETLDICSQIYVVNEGHILCEGSPETILASSDVRKVFLGEDFAL
jgi:lipopolysaccharide export system ATP-binding protein